jgi:hypothetical protein
MGRVHREGETGVGRESVQYRKVGGFVPLPWSPVTGEQGRKEAAYGGFLAPGGFPVAPHCLESGETWDIWDWGEPAMPSKGRDARNCGCL